MIEFQDAQKVAEENPGTFQLCPEAYFREVLKPGDCVKVCESRERFWVLVTAIDGEHIEGLVANQLIGGTSLEEGDAVVVEFRHIYDIYPAEKPKVDTEEGNLRGVHSTCL